MPQFTIEPMVKFIRPAIVALAVAATLGLVACTAKTVDTAADAAGVAENERQVAENAAKRDAQAVMAMDEAASGSASDSDDDHGRVPVVNDLGRSVEDGRTQPKESLRNESVEQGRQ